MQSVSQIRFQCQDFINTQSVRHHILNVYKGHTFQNQVYPWNINSELVLAKLVTKFYKL